MTDGPAANSGVGRSAAVAALVSDFVNLRETEAERE